jgi:phage terminase large subunit
VHAMLVDELNSLLLGLNKKRKRKRKKVEEKETKKIGICIEERSLWRVQSAEITGERYWREVVFSCLGMFLLCN